MDEWKDEFGKLEYHFFLHHVMLKEYAIVESQTGSSLVTE